MKKNILILTGSPRKGGNSALLADAFIVGAGRTTVKYVTAEKNINYQKWIDSIVPGVNEKGDILKSDGLIRAENLGKTC